MPVTRVFYLTDWVGNMYSDGQGVPRDLEKVKYYSRMAAPSNIDVKPTPQELEDEATKVNRDDKKHPSIYVDGGNERQRWPTWEQMLGQENQETQELPELGRTKRTRRTRRTKRTKRESRETKK